jgi:glyoxylase-like metal-dependent hydrolase (beta-lactamase superfamily II)
MELTKTLNNIYTIDTKMYGFDNYCAAYIVQGQKAALIDTGFPARLETVRRGIQDHGFKISDIAYIFVTHEHWDHAGNVAPLLRENPQAKVYVHPAAVEALTNPEIESARRKKLLATKAAEGSGEMEAVQGERIQVLKDGDTLDLGEGEVLKVIFAPGHQPGGLVILEEKNRGLFINDLAGNCFPEANVQYPLNPSRSDSIQSLESLRKLQKIPVQYLFLGHYGIAKKPEAVIAKALRNLEQALEIGQDCINRGKPEEIANRLYEMILPELEKLRAARGEELYQYATTIHLPRQMVNFANYCRERLKKQT